MNNSVKWLIAALAFGTGFQVAHAQTKLKHEALFDLSLDIDGDGKMDHAVLVLVGPGKGEYYGSDKSVYFLSEHEHVDLYIYLGAGDAALDISKPPSVLKKNIIDADRRPQVSNLISNGKGSLQVQSYIDLGSEQYEETITIVDRAGNFLVAGYREDWDTSKSLGSCDFKLLSGKATGQNGPDSEPKIPLKGKFKPVALADWSEKTRPKSCEN